MGTYTLRLIDCASAQPAGSEDDSTGWHVAVQGHPRRHQEDQEDQEDEMTGTQILIAHPFDVSIEKNIRWYLESFPTETPWELRKASMVQKQMGDYAIGIFRQLQILHSIGISPDVGTIIIHVSDRDAGTTPSNIFRLHWEVLENPKIWEELWALAFPPQLLRKRKPVPKVMVRRSIPQQEQIGHDYGSDWGDDDRSDGSGPIVTGSFIRSYQSDGRRSITQDQKVDHYVRSREPSISQQIHIKLSFFRILLVVARQIKTEKDTQLQTKKSTRARKKARDLDPSLISEPLLEVIDQLSGSLDVRLDVCRPGSWTALQTLLAQKGEGYYDLVHFDLHGDVLQPQGAGLCFLSSETLPNRKYFGKTVFTPAHEIGTVLREAGVLMVALNACETGREDPIDAQVPSTKEHSQNPANCQHKGDVASVSGLQINLAKTFVKCGVPSVLAMSYEITASFVTIFFKSFYNALLKSQSDVCEAVSIARQSLMSQKIRAVGFGLDVELEDWIIPVLYQSNTITFEIVSAGEVGSAAPGVAESQHLEVISARKKLLRRVFNRDSSDVKESSPRQIVPFVPQSTNRMLGRGLEILYVEALLLSSHSRRTLFLSGKYGIGKTHFIKGLGNSWALTGCISRPPVYIDCSIHPGWKAVDVLQAIIRQVTELDLGADSIVEAQTSLRNSQELIIIDSVEPETLSSEAEAVDVQHSLQKFVQSLDGGQSILIIISREDLRGQSGTLEKATEKCARFWQLSERDELAVQEVTLDILGNLRQSRKLNTKYETRDLRRFLSCLDFNPQLITLFLKAMSKADQLPNMVGALHNVLFSVVQLPLDDPESRVVRVAQKTFLDLGRLDNGYELQKLLLCLAQFSIFIPCGLDDEVFFPSAKSYLGYLRVCQVLEWPSSADASIVQPGVEISEVPSQMRRQLSELAKESIEPFCVLIEQLIDSDLVEFTRQSLQNEESRTAIENYHEGPAGTDSTYQLLMKLHYLRINPILTQYLRSQFGEGTSGPSHGFSQTGLMIAFCAYYKSFSISRWDEYASQQPNRSQPGDTTATADEGAFTSDSVFLHDACNIYSCVHIALALPHPAMRWPLLPVNVLNDLMRTAMRTFNPNILYKPLPTGFYTEESILILLRAVISYYEAAPRAERDSPTPLRITAMLSQGECWLMSYIGASAYSEIDVYHRQIKSRIRAAIVKMQKLRTKYGAPGEAPSASETGLGYLLEDIESQGAHDTRIRRLIGEESHADLVHEVRENNLLAAAFKGGMRFK